LNHLLNEEKKSRERQQGKHKNLSVQKCYLS
jgi:hypothetical protein